MTKQKDLKRLVRARMEKTGESYTTARAQLVRKAVRTSTNGASPTASAAIDYAALAGMADEKVHAKTGRTWKEWTALLDGHDATKLTHGERARLVANVYGTPDWWTQTVAVGYERIKGLRARGQRMDGTYEASKSRTFNVAVTRLYDAWAKAPVRNRWLNERGVTVRTSTRPKYLRLGWPDGTIAIIGFTPKGSGKSSVAVQHSKLPDRTAVEGLKRYWAEKLDALAQELK